MQFVTGTASMLSPDSMTGVARYRQKVFVEKLGWQLRCENGLEYDQFDRDDTIYVVAQNSDGDVIGTARLLPKTRPYLLSEVFSKLLNGLDATCPSDVWELSRFAADNFNLNSTSALGQFSSEIAVELLTNSLSCAARHCAKRVITVSPFCIARLLRKVGFLSHRVGLPVIYSGQPIFACSINCTTVT